MHWIKAANALGALVEFFMGALQAKQAEIDSANAALKTVSAQFRAGIPSPMAPQERVLIQAAIEFVHSDPGSSAQAACRTALETAVRDFEQS